MKNQFKMSFLPIALALNVFPSFAQEDPDEAQPAAGVESQQLFFAESELKVIEDEGLRLVNKARVDAGLRELIFVEDLHQAARRYSAEMAKRHFMSHVDPQTHEELRERMDKAGIRFRIAGENLGKARIPGAALAEIARRQVEFWLKSPSHRQNIMDGVFEESAIGAASTPSGKVYFTQFFLVRKK
ncbi:MAG: CAP domain-containing protein [Elusimicrobia bacterium]|nr:CAP domain-containing protein [Elusimicrobiota bacterium]